ncbi:SDR family NAD(P)-dependent oxidoreductase [Catenovulum sp. 2E275]|uniref:SDR family oxidoreductase n=1 Tax=Catenovulum sp. 2E275 TaxID=2980497 RepID=UPI0021CFA76A|nr:SDR family NAD(P)-dependent oxidoreductase [Catenovulum sp. 2E275]MCU4677555.1 SDR family NAD(P)-dependent oxidoreductase [Catenovulum sp. 2E275]
MNSNKTAIITGASSGIGRATCAKLIADGFDVIGISSNQSKLEQLKITLGDSFSFIVQDLTAPNAIEAVFTHINEACPNGVSLVVANAGKGMKGSVLSASLAEFEEVAALNYLSTVKFLKHASDLLKRSPSKSRDLIVIGSVSGKNLSPFSSLYGSTKSAIHAVTESLRQELSQENIRVSLFVPGVVKSNFQENAGYDQELVSSLETKFAPLLESEDIANLISVTVQLPSHINLSEIVVRPTKQAYP